MAGQEGWVSRATELERLLSHTVATVGTTYRACAPARTRARHTWVAWGTVATVCSSKGPRRRA